MVHLLYSHVNKVLHSLISLFFSVTLVLEETVPHHGEHLFPADEPVLVQVIDLKAILNLFFLCTLKHILLQAKETLCSEFTF